VLSLGLFLMWNVRPIQHPSAPDEITALHFETRHGEQLTRRLADNSVVHLNTDSAVTIRYGKTERQVMLTSGQAEFEVVHEPNRAFRVIAGSAEIVDLGTKFDVRREHDSTVVTVIEGRVAVGPLISSQNHSPRFVELSADQQIRVTAGEGPATPVAVEYNRYSAKPIEIATPALRKLPISGVFATDDTEAFIAFLRSLKGVRVEVTETQIRVW